MKQSYGGAANDDEAVPRNSAKPSENAAKKAKKVTDKQDYLGLQPSEYASRCPDPKGVEFAFLETHPVRITRLKLPVTNSASAIPPWDKAYDPFGRNIFGRPLLISMRCCKEPKKKCQSTLMVSSRCLGL